MKLNDKTTVKTLREMIGMKIRTRTSRETIEVAGIELTEYETWFIGFEGNRKRRIPIERVHELIEVVDDVKKSLRNFRDLFQVLILPNYIRTKIHSTKKSTT